MSEDRAASGQGMSRQQQVEQLAADRHRIAKHLMNEQRITYGEARNLARQQQVEKLVDRKGFSQEEALELTADVPIGEKHVTHQARQHEVDQPMGAMRPTMQQCPACGRSFAEYLIDCPFCGARTSGSPAGQEAGTASGEALAGWGAVGAVLVGLAWVLLGVAVIEVGYGGLATTDLGEYPGSLSALSVPVGLVGLVISLIVLPRAGRASRYGERTPGDRFLLRVVPTLGVVGGFAGMIVMMGVFFVGGAGAGL